MGLIFYAHWCQPFQDQLSHHYQTEIVKPHILVHLEPETCALCGKTYQEFELDANGVSQA